MGFMKHFQSLADDDENDNSECYKELMNNIHKHYKPSDYGISIKPNVIITDEDEEKLESLIQSFAESINKTASKIIFDTLTNAGENNTAPASENESCDNDSETVIFKDAGLWENNTACNDKTE